MKDKKETETKAETTAKLHGKKENQKNEKSN